MYRIIGADGKEYGPVAEQQLRQWIAEGRANAETRAIAEGSTEWKPLGVFPQFSLLFAAATPPKPPLTPPLTAQHAPMRRTNPYAITGLILGALSIFLCLCCHGLPFNLGGLVFSLIGLLQIKDNPEIYDGKGVAITGLALSLLSLLWAIAVIAIWGAAGRWEEMPYRWHRL